MTDQIAAQLEMVESRHRRASRWLLSCCNPRVRRRVGLGMLIAIPVFVMFAVALRRLRETPRIEPEFESIAEQRAGPVNHFALPDSSGTLHTMDEWTGCRAIVLVFCESEHQESARAIHEAAKLAGLFQPRGFLFLGVCEPSAGDEGTGKAAAVKGTEFPILFDPHQIVARQAGVRAVPAGVVLAPDGQVMYRGRVTRAQAREDGTRRRRRMRGLTWSQQFERSTATSCRRSSRPQSPAARFPRSHHLTRVAQLRTRRWSSREMSRRFSGKTVRAVTARAKLVPFRL